VRDACGLIDQRVPDLLILDLALPDGDGQQVGLHLLKQNPSPVIIVLSAQLHDFSCEPALLPHIHATVNKTAAYKELAGALRELGKGPKENFVEVALPKRVQAMSIREQEVFLLIGTGRSSREIAGKLNISLSTVESYRKTISQQIGVTGAELVRLASLHLYRMEQGLLVSEAQFDR
jgi:DNA-binding NarL/FixJ family response regulator